MVSINFSRKRKAASPPPTNESRADTISTADFDALSAEQPSKKLKPSARPILKTPTRLHRVSKFREFTPPNALQSVSPSKQSALEAPQAATEGRHLRHKFSFFKLTASPTKISKTRAAAATLEEAPKFTIPATRARSSSPWKKSKEQKPLDDGARRPSPEELATNRLMTARIHTPTRLKKSKAHNPSLPATQTMPSEETPRARPTTAHTRTPSWLRKAAAPHKSTSETHPTAFEGNSEPRPHTRASSRSKTSTASAINPFRPWHRMQTRRQEQEQLRLEEEERVAKETKAEADRAEAWRLYEQFKASGTIKVHYCGPRKPWAKPTSTVEEEGEEEEKRDSAIEVVNEEPEPEERSFLIDPSSDDEVAAIPKPDFRKALEKHRHNSEDEIVTCTPDGINIPPVPNVLATLEGLRSFY
ncbi:hypothetical protein NA57DRAFT_77403 [Rhizodiscina lignyota]|uniref:Uncharacterized protein n=1 Tax=Rhizodiscina lignyota TaxID=1504668 RepID=A0A9P4M8T9_9PEZI|nr:hypothetical protein NA57DRAFT_77403 [Rhizodiscina lignyota]